MNRRPKALACSLAILLAAALAARGQDNSGAGTDSGGAGTGAGSNTSEGITPSPGANALGTQGGQGTQGAEGGQNQPGSETTAPSGTGGPSTTTPAEGETPTNGEPSTLAPTPSTTLPNFFALPPGTAPANPPGGSTALNQGNLSAPTPITLSLPGGYGELGQSFTLGEGRFAKPPIDFTLTISEGYDDNIQSTANIPGRPAVVEEIPQPAPIINFRLQFPNALQPVYGKAPAPKKVTLAPAIPAQKPQGSAVTQASLGIEMQKGDPRTIFTLDGSIGLLDYWSEFEKLQYTGSLGINFLHRLTARAELSAHVDAVYQNQPDFSRINAPTSNVMSSFLNADVRVQLSNIWGARFSTITSYSLNGTLLGQTSGGSVYDSTYGIQFRYTVSPRNTATMDLRQSQVINGSSSGDNGNSSGGSGSSSANSTDTFLLVGLDSNITARLRNTMSLGEELGSYSSGGSALVPYFEGSLAYTLPRGVLSWSNRYGLQDNSSPTVITSSYRTTLSLSEQLSPRLGASVSVTYNYVENKDRVTAANSNNQTQFQTGLSLSYSVSPRFQLSLSYTYIDLLSSVPFSSYTRNQITLGGTHTF